MNNSWYISSEAWKVFTFAIGLFLLLLGAWFLNYQDWDVAVSILMACSTYLTADKFIIAIKTKSYPKVALFVVGAWWSIDGVYWLYWSLVDSSAMTREGQWLASLCLYLLCGLVWTAFPAGISSTILRQHLDSLRITEPKKDQNESYQKTFCTADTKK